MSSHQTERNSGKQPVCLEQRFCIRIRTNVLSQGVFACVLQGSAVFKESVLSIVFWLSQASQGTISLKIGLPEDHHLTKGANSRFAIATAETGAISFDQPSGPVLGDAKGEIRFEFRRSAAARAVLRTQVYFCVDGGACLFRDILFHLEFNQTVSGREDVNLEHRIAL